MLYFIAYLLPALYTFRRVAGHFIFSFVRSGSQAKPDADDWMMGLFFGTASAIFWPLFWAGRWGYLTWLNIYPWFERHHINSNLFFNTKELSWESRPERRKKALKAAEDEVKILRAELGRKSVDTRLHA